MTFREGARIDPDSWTHGSSAQRRLRLTAGHRSGQASCCDTFPARDLG